MPENFLSDQPAATDEFERKPFADRVAHVLLHRNPEEPLVVAIYGPWGDGKSTVLNFIRSSLSSDETCVVVNFNPWRFNSEEELLPIFFATLADSIDRSAKQVGVGIGEAIKKYAKYYQPALKLTELVNPIGSKLVGGLLDAAGTALSAADLERDKTHIDSQLRKAGKKVVVIMDDIDRLEHVEIRAIFKLIKLTADFANTAYVLAFDDEMVAASLGRSYASGSVADGRKFLEKIVQVPLALPTVPPDVLHQFLLKHLYTVVPLTELYFLENEKAIFETFLRHNLLIGIRTPRMCKRYVNAVQFAMALIGDQVYHLDLLLLEGLRIGFPSVYEAIRANPRVALGAALLENNNQAIPNLGKQSNEIFEKATQGMSLHNREKVFAIIKQILPYQGTESWEAGIHDARLVATARGRLCSPEVFDHFFAYSTPG